MLFLRRLLWSTLPMMIGVASLAPGLALAADPPPSVAQARQLFTDALKDQETGRHADALVKLQRVQSFRDTSPVRYQIAKCNEGLGKIAKARELYLRTVDGTQIPSTEDPSVASASREQAMRLASRIGYVRVDGPAMQDAEHLVALDDDEWAGAGLHEVDPGPHVLHVRADDGKERTVSFTAAAMATTSVKLFAAKPKPATVVAKTPEPAPAPSAHGGPTPWAWVSLGAGAAFLTGGIVMLAVRESTISSIEHTCPNDRCPTSSRDDIESKRSRAHTLLPLGIAASAIGGAGLALGGGLLLFGPRERSSTPASQGTRWRVTPLVGGAGLAAAGTF